MIQSLIYKGIQQDNKRIRLVQNICAMLFQEKVA